MIRQIDLRRERMALREEFLETAGRVLAGSWFMPGAEAHPRISVAMTS